MLKKKLEGMLCCLLLLSLLLNGCGDAAQDSAPADGSAADSAGEAAAVTEEETEPAPETLASGLPETDLDGFVLTLLRSRSYFIEQGVYTEELTGDPVPDAIYERNLLLEETYNCDIELLPSESQHPSTDVAQYVMSGDDTVDVLLDGGQFIANSSKNYHNLKELSYFDFEKPWWNQEFNDGITIGGKLYFTLGAYMTTARQNIYHVLFNKNIATDHGIDPQELYGLVRDGKWTLDEMIAYAKVVKTDLNGDGVYDTNDRWGLIGENYVTWTMALGAGFRCAEKDDKDIPVITFGSEQNVNILEKVMELAGNRETTIFAQRMTGVDDVWSTLGKMRTTSGCWLFSIGSLGGGMREMEDDYGVLPSPKYDETQSRYYHDASLGNSPTTGVPISASDPDTVAFLLEAMSYYSYYNVLPIFYDNYLNTKLARDEESVEMLQLIHDSIYYDLGALYNWGDMRMIIENMANDTTSTLASQYASKSKVMQKMMDRTLKDMGLAD